ncbi:NUDIX domain-containing protein [Oceanibium sediminis]|uniref:NUDIX domain-containing protein n=1 Tax=Oceanibium sediminis TaxID=2026339 RepID=UPI000DD48305|nr:NUDIX hydrolase [Oceanibium sediminis]
MRRFGQAPRPGIRYITRPGAYALIRRGRSLLVTEQSSPWPEIQLPGGGIDPGETPIEALQREALEETGWRLRVLRKLGVYQRYTYMPDYGIEARKICHIYLCAPGLHLGPPSEPGHRAFWMDGLAAAEALASPGDAWYAARALR